MKVQILQENLLKALQSCSRIISPKPQMPILTNILVKAEEGGMLLVSTNIETSKSLWVPSKIEETGALCVSARVFSELVSSLEKEKLQVWTEGEVLHVKGSSARAKIPGMRADEFPGAPDEGGEEVEVTSEIFQKNMKKVLIAAATDEGRPLLTGVCFKKVGEEVEVAATDGYRLSVTQMGVTGLFEEEGVVISARALAEVLKMDTEEGGQISVRKTSEGQFVFESGNEKVFTRVIDGEFPDYRKIIPSTFSTRTIVGKEDLLRAVKTAAVFAKENANIVRFSVKDKTLVVSANSPQIGENSVEIDVKTEGEDVEIAFNSRFLLDVLQRWEEEEVVCETTGALNPGVFRSLDDTAFFHIIMPVRVQSE